MKYIYSAERILLPKIFLRALLILLISSAAFAGDTGESGSNHYFQAGIVGNYFEYKEPGNIDVEISGLMAGISGKYTYRGRKRFVFSAEVEYTSDIDTEYDGATWGGTPVAADSDDWIIESRLLAGGEANPAGDFSIKPYTGLGIRYWYNDIEGAGSYRRVSDYWYIPVGALFTYKVSENFRWGIALEYDLFLLGHIRSYLSDVNPGYNDVDLYQTSGYGLRLSAPLTYRSFQIEPYLYYWDIDESDTELLTLNGVPYIYVYEPDNETTVFGIRINYLF
jgi:hypothetical protein